MHPNWGRLALPVALLLATSTAGGLARPDPVGAQTPEARRGSAENARPLRLASDPSSVGQILAGPTLTEDPLAPPIESARPTQYDHPVDGARPLPINLATALQLSNARPLVIAFAEARVEEAVARLQGANVLWLPNINVGIDYLRHDGADQSTDGTVIFPSRNTFASGAGATVVFSATDAVFRPLVARQELLSRQWDLQSARNDALLDVAAAYFDVQQARGQLTAARDAVAKSEDLVTTIQGLAKGLVAEIEVDRARTVLFDLQQEATARRRVARGQCPAARVLRLNPSSVVVPLEPPHLQVTLVSPESVVDDLIPVGLLNRPELASQRALVQATLERLRQERLRPLLPSVVLEGRSGPGGAFTGGAFGGGRNDNLDTWGGRFDADVGLVWTLNNLGAGNRALVRARAAERQQALIQMFDIQDRVAQDVVQAHAELEAAARQVRDAATEAKEAAVTFQGSLKGLTPRRVGNVLIFVVRPQEAVAALQQLDRAYQSYFAAVNALNRSQFLLYHALGFPSRILASERPVGELRPVDTTRPPQMAPTP